MSRWDKEGGGKKGERGRRGEGGRVRRRREERMSKWDKRKRGGRMGARGGRRKAETPGPSTLTGQTSCALTNVPSTRGDYWCCWT